MNHRALILSRPEDYGMAVLCHNALAAQGWVPSIMLDRAEWAVMPSGAIHAPYSTQGRGMFGVQCATAILRGILDNSQPGDVAAKFDCDIRLTDAASDWMKAAKYRGRCFMLGYRAWGGCWAAPRAQVSAALDDLTHYPPCSCPESGLIVNAMRDVGGMEAHTELFADKWIPGRPKTAGCLTLPTRCSMWTRKECGELLFA